MPSGSPKLIGSTVGVMVGVRVMVGVSVIVEVAVIVDVTVTVGVNVCVGVSVRVGVLVIVGVSVIVGVGVNVFVGVSVLVGVAVGSGVFVFGFGVEVLDGRIINTYVLVAVGLVAVAVTCGEASCVAVSLTTDVFCGFGVTVGASPPDRRVEVPCGVRKVSLHGCVKMSTEIGSITTIVLLSA